MGALLRRVSPAHNCQQALRLPAVDDGLRQEETLTGPAARPVASSLASCTGSVLPASGKGSGQASGAEVLSGAGAPAQGS